MSVLARNRRLSTTEFEMNCARLVQSRNAPSSKVVVLRPKVMPRMLVQERKASSPITATESGITTIPSCEEALPNESVCSEVQKEKHSYGISVSFLQLGR